MDIAVKIRGMDWVVLWEERVRGVYFIEEGEVVAGGVGGAWVGGPEGFEAAKGILMSAAREGGCTGGGYVFVKFFPVRAEEVFGTGAGEEEVREGVMVLEEEVRRATGSRVRVPGVRAGVRVVAACASVEAEVRGEKVQVRYRRWREVGFGAALVVAGEMVVWVWEVGRLGTVGGRVSVWMVGGMVVVDGFWGVVFAVAGMNFGWFSHSQHPGVIC